MQEEELEVSRALLADFFSANPDDETEIVGEEAAGHAVRMTSHDVIVACGKRKLIGAAPPWDPRGQHAARNGAPVGTNSRGRGGRAPGSKWPPALWVDTRGWPSLGYLMARGLPIQPGGQPWQLRHLGGRREVHLRRR